MFTIATHVGMTIQGGSHKDAQIAIMLYHKYQQLTAKGA